MAGDYFKLWRKIKQGRKNVASEEEGYENLHI